MAPNVVDYQDILWSRSMNSCVCNTLQLSLYLYTYLTTGIGHALLMTCSGSDGLSSSTSKVCSWLLLLCLGLYFDCGFLKMGDPSVSEVSWFISVSCTNHLYTLTYTHCTLIHPAHTQTDQYPQINDDLVNSHHLLLCCVDMLYCTCLMGKRKDLLNPGKGDISDTPSIS